MYISNFYKCSGCKRQMAGVPTTISLEVALKGKKKLFAPKPLKSANDRKFIIPVEEKKLNIYFLMKRAQIAWLSLESIKFSLTNRECWRSHILHWGSHCFPIPDISSWRQLQEKVRISREMQNKRQWGECRVSSSLSELVGFWELSSWGVAPLSPLPTRAHTHFERSVSSV